MSKYNLVTIRPKGFLHSSAFQEIKDSLAWSLTELGHEVLLTENAWASTGTNILFGAELLSPASSIPDNTIVFNMEQPSHPRIANVQRLATGHTVWEIYRQNMTAWQKLGIDARYLQIGYTPNLSRIPMAENQDIDIFFAGWMTQRRAQLLKQLSAAGLRVYASDSCYGGARDQIISRSKICLNIHHDGRDLFEIVRVSYLLANNKCVLSETSSDPEDHQDLQINALMEVEYEHIAEMSVALIKDWSTMEWRSAQEIFERRNFTESVRYVLGEGPARMVFQTSPVIDRYEQGLKSGDMKDFLPLLRGLAKGQILEIGVRDGASTSAFLLGLEDRDLRGHLYSVDIQDCSHLWSHPQWSFTKADSKTIVHDKETFDLIFIDGDHSREGFLADLRNAMRWIKPGGLILCHDISPLPNYTNEARGGDWPSEYVGEEFFAYCKEHKLRHFAYPGAWGMGVIIK